ncbi:hypothetical protein D3C81_1233750 [compost metagenome]
MPSMTLMMSAMRCEDCSMDVMVVTTWLTTSPPLAATSAAPRASWSAWRACSAFWRTVEVSSSIEAAVSSRLAACCSVRRERSLLPVAISLADRLMLPLEAWMRETMLASWSTLALPSSRMRANTPWKSPSMRWVRSPWAMACSSCERWPRLPSVVSISELRPPTISRKSCSKFPTSPRWLKSPTAAAPDRRLISLLIADRLALVLSMASVMAAFSPGRRSMSTDRSPRA